MEWIELLKRLSWFFLFCVVLLGCSSTKERSRLDFRQYPRHPFAPPGVTAMDVPRIEPMKLKPPIGNTAYYAPGGPGHVPYAPKAVVNTDNYDPGGPIYEEQEDPFEAWPSPLRQPPGK